MKDKNLFGNWLKQCRKALDLTQNELADKIGCSVASVRQFETNGRRPSKSMAQRLADVLGIASEERTEFIAFARHTQAIPSWQSFHMTVLRAENWTQKGPV